MGLDSPLDEAGIEQGLLLRSVAAGTAAPEHVDHDREPSSKPTPWETVQLARHRDRPYTLDYAKWVFTDFIELHGDRRFGDDRAVLGGPALLDGDSVMLVGHQKGRNTRENLEHNFGMPNPEGYRKAIRLFQQAEKLGMPIVTLDRYTRRQPQPSGRGERPGAGHRRIDRRPACRSRSNHCSGDG